jgi:peptidoglycan hydrolase CwlO-like protein
MSQIQLIAIGLAALFIAGVVAAGYFFVSNMQDTIRTQAEQISTLTAANKSLQATIEAKDENIQTIMRENTTLRVADAKAQQNIATLNQKLFDIERLQKEGIVSRGPKAELYLDIVNSSSKCFWENFGKTDGKCVRGVWKADKEEVK